MSEINNKHNYSHQHQNSEILPNNPEYYKLHPERKPQKDKKKPKPNLKINQFFKSLKCLKT